MILMYIVQGTLQYPVTNHSRKEYIYMGFPGGTSGKNPPANAGDMRCRFDPWVGKIPWRRAWHPTSILLPGKSHGQKRLAGFSP